MLPRPGGFLAIALMTALAGTAAAAGPSIFETSDAPVPADLRAGSLSFVPAADQPEPTMPAAADKPAAEGAKPADAPLAADTSFWNGWTHNVSLGLNGSEGNTRRINIRAGFDAGRKAEDMESKLTAAYSYARDGGENSENKARVDFRNDWLFKNSPWRFYALGIFEYDQFQAWDERLSAFGGPAYTFLKSDRTTLIGRAGFGLSREFGGGENAIVPELDLGADFEHKITERQKLTASIDYFPSLKNPGEWRGIGKAAWEVLIDPEVKLSLRVGVEDRYDSNPGDGFRRNDLDYFAMVVWSF